MITAEVHPGGIVTDPDEAIEAVVLTTTTIETSLGRDKSRAAFTFRSKRSKLKLPLLSDLSAFCSLRISPICFSIHSDYIFVHNFICFSALRMNSDGKI
jgi:hypothetical protein